MSTKIHISNMFPLIETKRGNKILQVSKKGNRYFFFDVIPSTNFSKYYVYSIEKVRVSKFIRNQDINNITPTEGDKIHIVDNLDNSIIDTVDYEEVAKHLLVNSTIDSDVKLIQTKLKTIHTNKNI